MASAMRTRPGQGSICCMGTVAAWAATPAAPPPTAALRRPRRRSGDHGASSPGHCGTDAEGSGAAAQQSDHGGAAAGDGGFAEKSICGRKKRICGIFTEISKRFVGYIRKKENNSWAICGKIILWAKKFNLWAICGNNKTICGLISDETKRFARYLRSNA